MRRRDERRFWVRPPCGQRVRFDRAGRRLLVHAAHAEPGAPEETPDELAAELHRMAGWLGLDDVSVAPHGDLAPALAASL